MKKLDRRGYTLVELLSIIVILGLISGITITVVLTTISNAKEKSKGLTLKNISNQAEKYVYEGFSDENWIYENSHDESKCVRVQDLIDVGYFKQSILDENEEIKADDIVKITRDRATKVVKSKDFVGPESMCEEVTTVGTYITCDYPSGYATYKDVHFSFSNGDNYEKRLYPKNGISHYSVVPGFSLTPKTNYFVANTTETYIRAKVDGVIEGRLMSGSNQINSIYCNVTEIDSESPTISLVGVDGENVWINSEKQINIAVYVHDDNEIDKNATISDETLNKIKVYVGDYISTMATKTIRLDTHSNSAANEAYYILTLSNINGNGKLKIKFPTKLFYDKAGNTNVETDLLETNYTVDNIAPTLESVMDNSNPAVSCYNVGGNSWSCTSWHAAGYYVTSNVNPSDNGSPIVGGYFKSSSSITTFNEDLAIEFPITSGSEANNKYMYIIDEAGNFNKQGYGKYQIKIDEVDPVIVLTASGKDLTCEIIDNESGVNGYRLCKEGTCGTSYTTYPGIINLSNVANGVWHCMGIDNVGNTADETILISSSNPSSSSSSSSSSKSSSSSSSSSSASSGNITISTSFKGKKINNNGETVGDYNSTWTKYKVKLIGKVTTNATSVQYVIDNSNSNPTSGWSNYTAQVTETKTGTQNKTYYFHVRYKNSGGSWQYKTESLLVKIDQTDPKCEVTITENKTVVGITIKQTCTDSNSGCTAESTTTHTKVKSSKTYTVTDNVGNTANCSKVTVKYKGYKHFCKSSDNQGYREACIADINDFWANYYLPTVCAYTHTASASYSYPIALSEIRKGKVRCSDKVSVSPNTGLSPYQRMVNKILGYVQCYNGLDPAAYLPKPLLLQTSHDYYYCIYRDTISDTNCTSSAGVLQRPSEGNWYKCEYRYYGTIG